MPDLLIVEQYVGLPDGLVRNAEHFDAAVLGRVPAQFVVDPGLEHSRNVRTYIMLVTTSSMTGSVGHYCC